MIKRAYAKNAAQSLFLLSASRGLARLLLGKPIIQLFASTLKHISNIYGYYCNFIFYMENLIPRSSAEDHPV